MREYKVTIAKVWSVNVEAENRNKAVGAGIRIFRQTVTDKLFVADLQHITRVKEVRRYANYDHVPEDKKQHFTGFTEGDGWPGINQGKLRLELYQKNPRILNYFRELFDLDEPVRKIATVKGLVICRDFHTIPLFETLKERVVTPHKAEQLSRALGVAVGLHRPTWPWTGGFYDAEGGCADGFGTFQLSIGQKDPQVARILRDFTESGSVYDYPKCSEIWWRGKDADAVYFGIRPFLKNEDAIARLEALRIFLKKGR